MKKIKIKTTADVDYLFKKVSDKAIESFRSGESVDVFQEKIIKYLMKKADLNEEQSKVYVTEFLAVMLTSSDEVLDEERLENQDAN